MVLAIAVFALYFRHPGGSWRWIYVVGAVVALYLNCFVGIVQAFQKVRFLNVLAPTQSDPLFIITQVVVMGIFVVFGVLALRSFHPRTDSRALASV